MDQIAHRLIRRVRHPAHDLAGVSVDGEADTNWISPHRQMIMVGGSADRQHVADWLDPGRIPLRVDETHRHFDRRVSLSGIARSDAALTSGIAESAEALRRISLAGRSSRFSRSRAFILSAISAGMPTRWPLPGTDRETELVGRWVPSFNPICRHYPFNCRIAALICGRGSGSWERLASTIGSAAKGSLIGTLETGFPSELTGPAG